VVQAAAAVRAALTNAYPEFQFEALLAMEDDFRGLLIGHVASGVAAQAANTRAAQLYATFMRRVARIADAFREGQAPEGELRDLFKSASLFAFLDEQHEANMATTEMVASLSRANGAGGYDPSGLTPTSLTSPPGKKRLNTLLREWQSSFGDACVYHHARGHCLKGAGCSKQHDTPVDKAAIVAWVATNNADLSA
jgi:hypothetical protein